MTALFILYCCYTERETAVESPWEEIPQIIVNGNAQLADFTTVAVMQEYDNEEIPVLIRSDVVIESSNTLHI